MSFLTIATWLQAEARDCPELQEKAAKLAELIEKNRELVHSEEELYEENVRLRMDVHTAQLEADRVEDPAQLPEQLRRQAENLVQLRAAFNMIDLNKMVENEELAARHRITMQMQESREEWERVRPMYEAMEQRDVVQELRRAQRELALVQTNQAEAKSEQAAETAKLLLKVKTATIERNKVIIRLVKGALESKDEEAKIQQMMEKKEKLEQRKLELQQQLAELHKEPLVMPGEAVVKPQSSTAPTSYTRYNPARPTFDMFNPFNFFKMLDANMPKLPSFTEYFAELQAKREAESEGQLESSLRPILNVSKTSDGSSQEKEEKTNQMKHVTFLLNSSMESSGSSAAAQEKALETNQGENTNAPPSTAPESEEIIVVCSQSQTQTIDLNTPEDRPLEIPSPEYEQFPDDEFDRTSAGKSVESLVSDEVKTSKLVEIQKCRIIKPAGTPLPKVLKGIALSPASTSPSPSPTADSFKKPEEPIAKKKKSSHSFFDEFLKTTADLSEDSMSETNGFESLFKSSMENANGSEDENDDGANLKEQNGAQNTGDYFDFDMAGTDGGNTDDFFELDMSDTPDDGRKCSTKDFL